MLLNSLVIPIREAKKRVNKKLSLIGLVTEFSFPRKSAGTDYTTTIRVVDHSCGEDELPVHFFANNKDHLPRIRSYKDFIVVSKVTIRENEGRFYAVYNKSYSSYALYSYESCVNYCHYQASPGFLLLESAKSFISLLIPFSRQYEVTARNNEYLVSMKNIGSRMFFDLVCKVLHVEQISHGEWMLFVWDGEDAPPQIIESKLEDEESNPLPLQVERLPLSSSILNDFPRVGTVLRVRIDQAFGDISPELILQLKERNRWMKIRNMGCKQEFGLWHGSFRTDSKIQLLSDTDEIVLQRKKTINDRALGTNGRLPLSSHPLSGLTVTEYTNLPVATLMDLQNHPQVDVKMKCTVRVVAIYQLYENCQADGSLHHLIRLTIEDPTARVHVFLCNEDKDKFFEGSFLDDEASTMKMNKLLGVPEIDNSEHQRRNPPWIECCIRSYDISEYHICGTRLVV